MPHVWTEQAIVACVVKTQRAKYRTAVWFGQPVPVLLVAMLYAFQMLDEGSAADFIQHIEVCTVCQHELAQV
jgi:hypothetical protein